MSKPCRNCNHNLKIWADGLCLSCDKIIHPEKYRIKPNKRRRNDDNIKHSQTTVRNRKSLKRAVYKPTGELDLFKEIYAERGMKCELTGKPLDFDVNCFAHILSKGAYPSFRLHKPNIIMVQARVHHLYDNSSKEKLLAEFPQAVKIYEAKDKLRYEYYNG